MASRLELFYGQPGSAKSTAVAHIIKQLYQQGALKKARVFIGDGSAATYTDMGLVDAGIVEVVDFRIFNYPISALEFLAEGAMPANPYDPDTKFIPATPESLEGLGLVCFEGLSTAGVAIMGDMKGALAYRAGRGEKLGQDSPIQITDGELDKFGKFIPGTGSGRTYGGNPISHFNIGQQRLAAIVERSKGFAGWVIWTAHEKAAENKLTGEKIIGPEGVGNASTPMFPRMFNNTLHFATVEKTEKQADGHTGKQINFIDAEYRIYTRNHFRAEGTQFTKYLATTRITHPEMMPAYVTSEKAGESITKFYSIVEESKRKAKEELVGPKEEAAA